ncbi:MAG: hypothetical protein GVY30_12875 [Chloroflexi bacterium]|nr:hypothetical protein [Chloroflexota bacterium]
MAKTVRSKMRGSRAGAARSTRRIGPAPPSPPSWAATFSADDVGSTMIPISQMINITPLPSRATVRWSFLFWSIRLSSPLERI